MLTITTTHLKIGWIRRNGVPRSDRATVTEHWIRHGDHFTIVTVVNDPVYLTEPFVRSTDFVLDLHQVIAPYPCESVEEVRAQKGEVPHHLPGTNPYLNEFATRNHVPEAAARGGAATMYPEYMRNVRVTSNPVTVNRELPDQASGAVHILPVPGNAQGSVYMLVGAGANITVQIGKDGVLLVDAGGGKPDGSSISRDQNTDRQTDSLHSQYRGGHGPGGRQREIVQGRQYHHRRQRGGGERGMGGGYRGA